MSHELSRQLHNAQHQLSVCVTVDQGKRVACLKKAAFMERQDGRKQRERWARVVHGLMVDAQLDEGISLDLKEYIIEHLETLRQGIQGYK